VPEERKTVRGEIVQTTVTVRLLFRLIAIVVAVVSAMAGPSIYVAWAAADRQWVPRAEFLTVKATFDKYITQDKQDATRIEKKLDQAICLFTHGPMAWDIISMSCKPGSFRVKGSGRLPGPVRPPGHKFMAAPKTPPDVAASASPKTP